MSIVVFSPHTDDAIFSIGAHLATLDDVIIATVFAGIPTDPAGHAKHTTLRAEHTRACQIIGATEINSTMLDDVYPPSPPQAVREFIAAATSGADIVYVPIGIHHPDHLTVTTAALELLDTMPTVRFYDELPYRIDYRDLAITRHRAIKGATGQFQPIDTAGDNACKLAAVGCYASQTDARVIDRVMQHERVWELIR